MKTLRNLALCFALVGTSVSSLSKSIEVSDPTVAGSETLNLMKTKRSTHDVNKMDNPILSVNKMDNPILSVNKMDNPILSPLEF